MMTNIIIGREWICSLALVPYKCVFLKAGMISTRQNFWSRCWKKEFVLLEGGAWVIRLLDDSVVSFAAFSLFFFNLYCEYNWIVKYVVCPRLFFGRLTVFLHPVTLSPPSLLVVYYYVRTIVVVMYVLVLVHTYFVHTTPNTVEFK